MIFVGGTQLECLVGFLGQAFLHYLLMPLFLTINFILTLFVFTLRFLKLKRNTFVTEQNEVHNQDFEQSKNSVFKIISEKKLIFGSDVSFGLKFSFVALLNFCPTLRPQKQIQILQNLAFKLKMESLTLQTVMRFLRDGGFQESWLTLEKQSQCLLFSYPKQIQFLRKLIIKGDFEEVLSYLATIKTALGDQNLQDCVFYVLRQKLLEQIQSPNDCELQCLFSQQMPKYGLQSNFEEWFSYLTYSKPSEIQGLEKWTVAKGRIELFQCVLPLIEEALGLKVKNRSQIRETNETVSFSGAQKETEKPNTSTLVSSQFLKSGTYAQDATSDQKKIGHKKGTSQEELKGSRLSGKSGLVRPNKVKQAKVQVTEQQEQNELSDRPPHSDAHFKENNLSQLKPIKSFNSSKNMSAKRQNLPQDSYLQKSNISELKSHSKIGSQNVSSSQYYAGQNKEMQSVKLSRSVHQNFSQHGLKGTYKEEVQQFLQEAEQNSNQISESHEEVSKEQVQNFTFSQHNNFVPYSVTQQGLEGGSLHQTDRISRATKLATVTDSKAIRTCSFSNSGSFFAVGTNSSVLKVYFSDEIFKKNVFQEIQPIYEINGLHSKSIFSLDWASNQQSIVTSSNDLTIKVTDFNPKFDSHNVSVIGRHESCIRMVKFNTQQNKIFSGGDDGLIKIWDMGKVKKCYNLRGHKAGVSAFRLGNKENQLLSVSKDKTLKKWDLRSLECVGTSQPQECEMTFIANNTDRIVTADKSGNVSFFNEKMNLEYSIRVHQEEIRSIQAGQGGQLFITASFDGHMAVFREQNVQEPAYFAHNQNSEDKVVYATFLNHSKYRGFASTSTLGLCHIYSYI